MPDWIHTQSQFLLLAGGCLLAFGAQYLRMHGLMDARRFGLVWLLAAALLGVGWGLAEAAAAHERRHIQTVTEGFARLYAVEMEQHGHARLASAAAADDPLYLSLIETEKSWLALNPAVNDIYTLRKRADGRNAFLVDSETDYDRNGKYDGERERRTAIGEIFEAEDAALEGAFRGERTFEFEPVTDRWGTWLSAYAPLHDASGAVEGVLGVDFEAAEFTRQVTAAKTRVLSLIAFVELVLLASSLFVAILQARVAEQQRAEWALRASEERFANAFQYAAIGMALIGPEGRWLKVNRALCELVGYCTAELLTMTIRDITHPDDLEKGIQSARQLLTGEVERYQLEKRYLHKHGHEVLVLLNVSLVRDAAGQPLHFIAQIQDITERRRVEEDLREKEHRFRHLIETLPAATYTCDTKGRITLYNKAAVELWGCEPVIGKDLRCGSWRIHNTDGQPVSLDDCPVAQTLRTGVPIRGREVVVERPDGVRVHVLAHPEAMRDAAGRIVGAVNILVDITYRKAAEAEIEKMNRELIETSRQAGMAEVATSVLHNVGNVLNSVNVSATLVMETVRKSKAANLGKLAALFETHAADLAAFITNDPQGRRLPEYLRQLHERLLQEQQGILAELAGLTKNIEHIKDIVAMQQSYGKISGVREVLSITELVEDSLRLNAASLCKHEVEVVRDFQPVPAISVEKHKVLQILVNLIRNAKQSCDEAGSSPKRLTLRVANGDGRIKIAVSDNGVGISPENLARIFNHGFTTKKEGHGFGLHSGALAARELGGELRVGSEGTGRGATFTLELPVEASA